LEALLEELLPDSERPSIVVADSHDRESLDRLTCDTKVVLSTVGPYSHYGSELVASCVANGTDYCDLTAEVEWCRKMIDLHQVDAQKSGARLVSQCGVDSIPSDLGTFFMQEHAIAKHGRPCTEITMLVRSMRGGFSGSSIASLSNSFGSGRRDEESRNVLKDPYGLNPQGERDGPDGPDETRSRFSHDAERWTTPFVMAPINTRVVRRTNALLGYIYGRDFCYSEAMITGKGIKGRCLAAMLSLGQRLLKWAFTHPLTQRLALKLAPKPGEGPSREEQKKGYFEMLFLGEPPDGEMMHLVVKGEGDPGFTATSRMFAESGVCLAKDGLDVQGGFWTPASAMGEALRKRLVANAGMSFEWQRGEGQQ
jgi:short subunit dehydrogenase-like uncharacterized protein